MTHVCKNCGGAFNEWTLVSTCQNCDDGMAEVSRDIDFTGEAYCRCYVCNGSGEISHTETDYCCEECFDDALNDISTTL